MVPVKILPWTARGSKIDQLEISASHIDHIAPEARKSERKETALVKADGISKISDLFDSCRYSMTLA